MAVARAAASSAPEQAGQIVAAICRKLPGSFSKVCLEVAGAAPAAGPSIKTGLLDAIPALKPFVDRAVSLTAAQQPTAQPVFMVLAYTTVLVSKAAASSGMTVEQLLEKGGITPDETWAALWTAKASLLSVTSSELVPLVPGGGKTGDTNRIPTTVVVEKGRGRQTDYSTP